MTARVSISPSVTNNLMILKCPLSGAGLALATSTNLSLPAWVHTTNAILETNPGFSTSVPMDGGNSTFFRLQPN